MRILFIHTRGYHASGPETYLQNIGQILDQKNIQHDLFCLDYSQNDFPSCLPNLPEPIGSIDVYQYSGQNLSAMDKGRVFLGSIFRIDVYKRLNQILAETRYDKIIVLQYFLKMSPAVFLAAKNHSVEILFRQSDFGLICARNTFYKDGAVCTLCTKNQFNMVINKCSGGSLTSALVYLIYKINHAIIRYSTPKIMWTNLHSLNQGSQSNALKNFNHILNYTPKGLFKAKKNPLSKIFDFGCIGRISMDKGVNVLLNQLLQMPMLNFKFLFLGVIDNELVQLANAVKIKHSDKVVFIDKVPQNEVCEYMNSCKFLVFTSSWFDNLPNTLIEAYSSGIPCLLPDFGCFKEFIPSQFPQLCYQKGDEIPLSRFSNGKKVDYNQMSAAVTDISMVKFSNSEHLKVLIDD